MNHYEIKAVGVKDGIECKGNFLLDASSVEEVKENFIEQCKNAFDSLKINEVTLIPSWDNCAIPDCDMNCLGCMYIKDCDNSQY